jgi:hypothetical protein
MRATVIADRVADFFCAFLEKQEPAARRSIISGENSLENEPKDSSRVQAERAR